MANSIVQNEGSPRTTRINLDNLDAGWSTRSYPHEIPINALAVLDNFVHARDNIWSLRPGNVLYGAGTGATGSGSKALGMSRFYGGNMTSGQLSVHSGTGFYTGNDTTGAFTSRNSSMSSTNGMTTAQMYDPDNTSGAATSLFVCDGSRVPQLWDGTNFIPVQSGGSFLPSGVQSGTAIKPLYVTDWNYHLVYGNEATDPTALWISDALRPERFTGTSFTDSGGTNYVPYYPGGKNSSLGVLTGVAALGPYLIIFFTNGIVTAVNTGSYGAFQYVFTRLSKTVGCPSPRSIVVMDFQVLFFGGDRFYATDGQSYYPLPDMIPTVYTYDNIAQSTPEIADITTVAAARYGLSYLASYDVGLGYQQRIVCFDTQANAGWNYQGASGGAWSRFTGMSLSAAVECRGPGDKTRPFFWGNSNADQIAQFDSATSPFTDFGSPINCEIRTKSFFLDEPIKVKEVIGLYPVMVFTPNGTTQSMVNAIQPYVYFDTKLQNFSQLSYTVTPSGVLFGQQNFGTFLFQSGTTPSQQTLKSYPPGGPQQPRGFSVAAGLSAAATAAFNIIGFTFEVIVDEPEV